MQTVAAIIAAAIAASTMTCHSNPFTDAEIELFHSEGWDVFLAEGSMLNENGDRPYQLQRLDEEAILMDDAAAWRLVWKRAAEGSQSHQKALDFLMDHSMPEYEAIRATCQTH